MGGHIAEFFDFTSSLPEITIEQAKKAKRIDIEILDSYSLFDRKTEGEWRIIGTCNNYIHDDVEDIIFLRFFIKKSIKNQKFVKNG